MNTRKVKSLASAFCGTLVLAASTLQAQVNPITTGLQLWLNADVGVTTNLSAQLTAWADQSGLGNNASQGTLASAPVVQPASLNGHATVRVTGSQFMEVLNANGIDNLLNDVSILTVVKYDNAAGYRGVVSKCTGGVGSPFDFWNNAGANGGRTSFYLGNGAATTATLSSIAPPVGVYNVMSFRWKDGLSSQFLNDFNIGDAPNAAVTGNGGTNLRIGRRQDGTVQLLGNIAEILIYKPALSDSDIYNVINNYLKPKYALTFDAAPSVSITSPANASTFPAASSIPVTISASDSDGYPASVALYANGTQLLGTGTAINTNSSSTFQLSVAATYPGTMTLTAVATDNYGRPSTSAPVLVNISGSAPSSPLATGLKTWLSGDSGTVTNSTGSVTNWTDRSGNANDGVQIDEPSAPLIVANAVNGKPVLRFDGVSQFMEVSDAGTAFLTNDFTTFAVARFVGSYPALRQHVWSKCGPTGLAGPVDWWLNTTTGVPFGYRGDGVNFAGAGNGIAGPLLGAYTVLGMEVTGADGVMAHYLGASPNGSSVALTNTASAGLPLRIGRRADGGTQLNGDIAEILIYDQALSGTDRTNVTTYLAAKYNLVQPYNATPPPTVTITSPINGSSFPAPTTVTLSATASSANGVITRVMLLANGQTFATLTNAPYQVRLDLLTPGTVTFNAVAVDNWGVQSSATPVVLTLTGTASAPALTNGLKTWLAADLGVTTNASGAVTSWVDQSASGNDAAAPDPATAPLLIPNAMNGKPVLRFNGGTQVLEVPPDNTGFTAGDLSTFAIVKISNYSTFRTIWSKALVNRPAPDDWYFASGSGAATVYRGNGPTIGNVVGAAPPLNSVVVVGWKAAGQAISQYIGYNVTGSGNITAPLGDGGSPLRIGRRADGATQMSGDIAEILIYDHAVSDSERLQVVNYLYAKWGITVVQVANVAPTVTLTSPTNGTPVSAPSTISVIAQATDPDSPITRVDFLANGLLVASRTTAPYQIPLDVMSPGPLTLQAQAVDFWGAVGTSAPVVLNIVGSGPSAPPSSGRVLWLKADAGVTTNPDGTVITWADQSGNANDAAQDLVYGSPTPLLTNGVGGRPMLNYDGTLRYLVIPPSESLSLTNDMSLFSAVSVDDFADIRSICSKGLVASPHPFDYFYTANALAQVNRGDNRGTSAAISSGKIPAGTNVVTGFTVQGSIGTHYLQGLPNGTGQFGYGTIDDGTQLYLGSRDDLNIMFKGNFGELLIYDRLLVGSELQAANTYLAGRYGIATAQFSTQPPTLTVGKNGANTVLLSWLAGYTGFILEGRTNLTAGSWTAIATNPPNNQVTLGTTNATRLFRLRSQ